MSTLVDRVESDDERASRVYFAAIAALIELEEELRRESNAKAIQWAVRVRAWRRQLLGEVGAEPC